MYDFDVTCREEMSRDNAIICSQLQSPCNVKMQGKGQEMGLKT